MNIDPNLSFGGPKARPEKPYLFAYDVAHPKRLRQVLRCLQRWRVDGQYSVHETWLRPVQMRELVAELLLLVDRQQDRLFVARLRLHGGHPVRQLTGTTFKGLQGQPIPRSGKGSHQRHDGLHLIAYDVRDPKRLHQVHRLTQKQTITLQKSVFLHRGSHKVLEQLLQEIRQIAHRKHDDIRVYGLTRLDDLWFLSGDKPPLANWADAPHAHFWQRLLQWFRTA